MFYIVLLICILTSYHTGDANALGVLGLGLGVFRALFTGGSKENSKVCLYPSLAFTSFTSCLSDSIVGVIDLPMCSLRHTYICTYIHMHIYAASVYLYSPREISHYTCIFMRHIYA